jgi:endonuclease/exonuclease/phosphatase family metal-dependent hydrolase
MGEGEAVGRVRVATYNLYLGADLSLVLGHRPADERGRNLVEVERQLSATAFPPRAAAVARLLARERPDLVGLQEMCTWSSDGVVLSDYTGELLTALTEVGAPYETVARQTTFTGTGATEADGRRLQLEGSNVILRRRDSEVRVQTAGSGLFGSSLTLPMESGEVRIARGWCDVLCTLDGLPGSEFRFVDTHTEAYEPDSRNRQRDELLDLLIGTTTPLVVVGDFNARPGEIGMPPSFDDAWTAAGNASEAPDAATCCQAADLAGDASRLDERIDYVWVCGLRSLACRRIGADLDDRTEDGRWPSDHAGVVADLTLV